MNTDIHRLLDEAFTGIEMSPEARDLKEEVRANLVARVAEMEAAGGPPAAAAQRAIAELGDVGELLERIDGASPASAAGGRVAAAERHRVRPRPGFVVRVVVASLVAAIGLTLAALAATEMLTVPLGVTIALLGVAATSVAWIVGDSLTQETTTNHPMPRPRAGGYFLATFLAGYGLGLVGLIALGVLPVWGIVFAALGIVAAIILFAWLGATQTNRHKAWVRRAHPDLPVNRFEEEPETAARFGIYTAVIWLVTFGVIVVLVFTIGWWWTPVAFLGGIVVMMLVLARMMFGPRSGN